MVKTLPGSSKVADSPVPAKRTTNPEPDHDTLARGLIIAAQGLPEAIRDAENPAEASGAEPSVRNTVLFNLYGIPTISVPCGFSRSGLPIGLQISGPRLGEPGVLALAHAYEQATAWHRRRPALVGA